MFERATTTTIAGTTTTTTIAGTTTTTTTTTTQDPCSCVVRIPDETFDWTSQTDRSYYVDDLNCTAVESPIGSADEIRYRTFVDLGGQSNLIFSAGDIMVTLVEIDHSETYNGQIRVASGAIWCITVTLVSDTDPDEFTVKDFVVRPCGC